MPFQPIDMQLSVPRTPEQGGIQSQAAHRAVSEQQQLAERAGKETEMLRMKNAAVEQSAGLHIRSDRERGREEHGRKERRKQASPGLDAKPADKPSHPYKGHRLDISL